MKEKCCENCLYFEKIQSKYHYYTEVKYNCTLHKLYNGEVREPHDQFCGDEHWISSKVKTRIENLEKLGI